MVVWLFGLGYCFMVKQDGADEKEYGKVVVIDFAVSAILRQRCHSHACNNVFGLNALAQIKIDNGLENKQKECSQDAQTEEGVDAQSVANKT